MTKNTTISAIEPINISKFSLQGSNRQENYLPCQQAYPYL